MGSIVKFLNKILRRIGIKSKYSSLYKYSKKEWLKKAKTLDENSWAKEYTEVWETFMSTEQGRDALMQEENVENRVGMQIILKEIERSFSKNANILEVEGGTGTFSIRVAQNGNNIVCSDCNVKALEVSKNNIVDLNPEIRNKITFKESFADNLPFPNNSFDAVVCMEVLEHLVDPRKAVSEFNRVLKDNGKVYVTVPYENRVGSPFHIQKFTLENIRILFEEFFYMERLELCPFLWGTLIIKLF